MSTRPPSVTRTDTLFPVTTRFRSGNAGLGQLDPGQAQHLGRAVDAERAVGGGAEQLDHTAGAGADVDEPADRPVSESAGDRRLDLALGDVERAKLVPFRGMLGEIAFGCGGAIGLDSGKPTLVGPRPGILASPLLPFVEQREQRLDTLRPAEAEENPAS